MKKKQDKERETVGEYFKTEDIASILEMLEKHNVNEFKLERGHERISLKRGAENVVYTQASAAQQITSHTVTQQTTSQVSQPQTGEGAAPAPVSKNLLEAKSPMVGTFYRRPALDADPYVNVGDIVKKGDVLCIVEAMKLMNEIESEVSGKVVEICIDDAQMVEYGEVLFRVDPNG